MHKTKNHHSEYDLQDDLQRIKAALADATYDVGGKAREILQNSLDDMKEKSHEMQDNVSRYVVKKPLKSVGIAMLAGAIIGYLMHK